MEGFGVHTFRLVNAEDRSTFVKFHWKPSWLQSVAWNERSCCPDRRHDSTRPTAAYPGQAASGPR